MKILALGATGVIGSQVVAVLAKAGYDITITSRQDLLSNEVCSYVRGDARDANFIKSILQDSWDVIIDFMIYDTAEFERRIDILLGGAKQQYLFMSSARVFAHSDSPLTERSARLLDVCSDAQYIATDDYALAKARQEDLLRSSGKSNWTIVRPYITFGEGRLQLGTLEKEGWLYRALRGRGIVFCSSLLDKRTTLTDGVNVAEMIASVVGESKALGQDYNLTGSKSVTWFEVLTLYLNELETFMGRRPQVLLQNLETFCDGAKFAPQVSYDRMYNRVFDSTKIMESFDIKTVPEPLHALRTRLRTELVRADDFRAIDWRREALYDRALRNHAHLNEIEGLKSRLRYLGYRHCPLHLIDKYRRM